MGKDIQISNQIRKIKGKECIPAKIIFPNLQNHNSCEPGFISCVKYISGKCIDSEFEKKCTMGKVFVPKICHYDIEEFDGAGQKVCKHIHKDDGLVEIDDCVPE